MSSETMSRFMEAAKYQRMAVEALLPEGTSKHMQVIEKELSAMLYECAMELVKTGCMAKKEAKERTDNKDGQSVCRGAATENKSSKMVRKVEIG